MNKSICYAVALLVTTLCSPLIAVAAEEPVAMAAQQDLRQLLKKFDGFTAEFSQTVTDSEARLIHQGEGKLAFEQPGKFLWELVEPEPELLVSNGETLWWFNPFLEQVSMFDAKDAVQTTPFALLVSQDEDIWQQFSISKQQQDYVIEPIDDNAQVVKLVIRFEQAQLTEILVMDRTQQTSTYRLSKQTFNNTKSVVFDFKIPTGIEIDDQRASPVTTDGNVQY